MTAEPPGPEGRLEGLRTTNVGKYQLFASLGRGGMADVLLAVARGPMGFNKLTVIKRLRQALAEQKPFRTMFLDEARLAARLSHPNIVHTYEVGEENGVYFIAMEYLEGQSLNKVLKEVRRLEDSIEPEVAVRVVADALSGLGYAHDLRDYDGRPLSIVHRDISPHNIFVTYDGHTKVVDFGIAKAALSTTETEVGILKGKVAYMSPEQAGSGRMDARADLFSMGIVLWELLTHQRLLAGESAAHTLHKLMNEPIPRLSEVMEDVDPDLDAIVARALEKDPERRWQTAGDMREALESWLAAQATLVRHDDVARTMQALFSDERADVQRQVRGYMAGLALADADDASDVETLTAASLERMQKEGTNAGGLLLLGGSGTGTGVAANYANYGGLTSTSPLRSGYPPAPPARGLARPQVQAVILAGAFGVFLLAAILIVVRGRREPPADAFAGSDPRPIVAPAPAPVTAAPPVEPAPVEPAPVVLAPTAPPEPGEPAPTAPTGKRGHGSARGAAATKAPKETPAPAADEPGFLTISSYPWAKVSEGGKTVCPVTPCNKVQLSAGSHSLTFENGEQPGQKQTVSVVVKSGEFATKNVSFK